MKGTQAWKLEAGIDTETMEGHHLLTSPPSLLSRLSYITQDHLARELHPSTSIFNRDNAPPTCLLVSLMEAFSQVKRPSQMTLACVDRKPTSHKLSS